MPDALLDLFLGSRCAVCERPGRVLCPTCRADLPRRAVTCWPTPRPAGMARPTAVGEYADALKRLVNAHKEEHRFALARPLGDLLATAVLDHVRPPVPDGGGRRRPEVVLVPVPSRGSVVRDRGHDPLLRVTRHAAVRLRATGVRARVARLLRSARAVEDQAGLGAQARATNLRGSMICPPARARGLVRPRSRDRGEVAGSPLLVVVDDVITTGATLLEAQRALEERGLGVAGAAVVAATRRTSGRPVVHLSGASPPRGGDDSRASLPFCDADD